MPYQVKNTRNDDGTYTLSYGRGKKKLTATVVQGPDGWWSEGPSCPPSCPFPTLKECKAAWGMWAEAHYEQAETTPGTGDPADKKGRSSLLHTSCKKCGKLYEFRIRLVSGDLTREENDARIEQFLADTGWSKKNGRHETCHLCNGKPPTKKMWAVDPQDQSTWKSK